MLEVLPGLLILPRADIRLGDARQRRPERRLLAQGRFVRADRILVLPDSVQSLTEVDKRPGLSRVKLQRGP
jgi:hypothetical protein